MSSPTIDPKDVALVARLLKKAGSVAILTGAGVSAESGVPTFRASDGLWEGHRIEDVATPEGFRRDPDLVWKFYNARRANVATVQPNAGHFAMAELEKQKPGNVVVITQNVDGLHQAAGSQSVLELHGSLRRTRCQNCDKIEDRGLEPLAERPECPHCGKLLRPDIVWFGEALPGDIFQQAGQAAGQCDVFMVIGTSAVVYPAAGLIDVAAQSHHFGLREFPATIVEINLTQTAVSDKVDVGLYGPSGEILPLILKAMKHSGELRA